MSAHGPSLPRRPRASVSVIRCLAAALGRWPARQLMTRRRLSRPPIIALREARRTLRRTSMCACRNVRMPFGPAMLVTQDSKGTMRGGSPPPMRVAIYARVVLGKGRGTKN